MKDSLDLDLYTKDVQPNLYSQLYSTAKNLGFENILGLNVFLDKVKNFSEQDQLASVFVEKWEDTDSTQMWEYWRQNTKENIQMTTIHSSKGLEYKFVFIPTLGKRTKASEEKLWLTKDLLHSIFPEIETPKSLGYLRTKSLQKWHKIARHLETMGELFATEFKNQKDDKVCEEYNTLYVAITRAEMGMYLYGEPMSKSSSSFYPDFRSLLHRFVIEKEGAEELNFHSGEIPNNEKKLPNPITPKLLEPKIQKSKISIEKYIIKEKIYNSKKHNPDTFGNIFHKILEKVTDLRDLDIRFNQIKNQSEHLLMPSHLEKNERILRQSKKRNGFGYIF